jgi:hypothetical protein
MRPNTIARLILIFSSNAEIKPLKSAYNAVNSQNAEKNTYIHRIISGKCQNTSINLRVGLR